MPPSHPENVTTAAAGIAMSPPPRATRRHEIAHIVSIVIHPLLFPLLTLIVVGLSITHDIVKTTVLAVLSVAVTSVPVALVVWVQVKRGAWSDLDVSHRRQRFLLYPFTLACLGLLAVIYAKIGVPAQAIRSVIGLLLASFIDGAINLYWKVSAHATTAAACAALLWQLVPGTFWGPTAAAGAALVGWSRVELGRHTKGQVIAGWFVGAGTALVALNLFH